MSFPPPSSTHTSSVLTLSAESYIYVVNLTLVLSPSPAISIILTSCRMLCVLPSCVSYTNHNPPRHSLGWLDLLPSLLWSLVPIYLPTLALGMPITFQSRVIISPHLRWSPACAHCLGQRVYRLPVCDLPWVQVHQVSAFPLASLSLKGPSQPTVCLLNTVGRGRWCSLVWPLQ